VGSLNAGAIDMTKILRVVLIVLIIALAITVGVRYWPDQVDPASGDIHQRLRAVDKLAGRTDQQALDTLGQFTGDSETRVARSAIRVIGGRSDDASRMMLKQIAEDNESGVLRGTAAAELGNFKKTDYRMLADMMLCDKDPNARAGAAKGLRRLRLRESVDSLLEAMGDSDAVVRLNAAGAVGVITGRWFKFDASGSDKTRADQINAIKRQLIQIKSPHGH
jgi:HEAT repeat protein